MALVTPEFLQTKKYPALRHRLAIEHGGALQAGAWGANDVKPAQRAAGANMSVDVSAGFALVSATDPGNRGLYHVENDATVNAAVAASHATLPRLDQVILTVNDTTDGGDGVDNATITVLAGTPGAGTTLDNRNGAAGLPNTTIRLADVLVPAASTSVVTGNIRDRRQRARGWYSRLHLTTGGTLSTTSATLVSIVNVFANAEISGLYPVRITLHAFGANSAANAEVVTSLRDNGIDVYGSGGNIGGFREHTGADWYGQVGYVHDVVPTTGRHVFEGTIRAQWGGTAKVDSFGDRPIQFNVEEILKAQG